MPIKPRSLHKSDTPAQAAPDTKSQTLRVEHLTVDRYEEAGFLSMRGHAMADARMGPGDRVEFVFSADAADDLQRFRCGMASVEPGSFTAALLAMKRIVFQVKSKQGGGA